MKAKDMNAEELLALGGLMRAIVRLDGKLSREEATELDATAEAFGVEDFWGAIEEAGAHSLDDDSVKEMARAVTRLEARETLYAAIAEVAEAGSVVGSEGSLLDWLAEEWKLVPHNLG